ncbi:MAG: transcription factor RcaD, partial [Cyanobacteria bacterium QH_2_48_84]
LQPPLSREDLDWALYRLEKNNQIELSALQETMQYTTEQIQAGIPQDVGGSLFFIVVS